MAGATSRAIATISDGSTTIVNHENRKTLYAAHGYQEGIGEGFRWVSVGYRWVSGVSPRDSQAAATKYAKGLVFQNTQGTLVRIIHTMHENTHIVLSFHNWKLWGS